MFEYICCIEILICCCFSPNIKMGGSDRGGCLLQEHSVSIIPPSKKEKKIQMYEFKLQNPVQLKTLLTFRTSNVLYEWCISACNTLLVYQQPEKKPLAHCASRNLLHVTDQKNICYSYQSSRCEVLYSQVGVELKVLPTEG